MNVGYSKLSLGEICKSEFEIMKKKSAEEKYILLDNLQKKWDLRFKEFSEHISDILILNPLNGNEFCYLYEYKESRYGFIPNEEMFVILFSNTDNMKLIQRYITNQLKKEGFNLKEIYLCVNDKDLVVKFTYKTSWWCFY